MGTHPIFESDFDCLTDYLNFHEQNERTLRSRHQFDPSFECETEENTIRRNGHLHQRAKSEGNVVANTPKYQLGTAQSIQDRNLIDSSSLLTDKDKTKPDAESLKAPCGPPGAGKKKRACAGCT